MVLLMPCTSTRINTKATTVNDQANIMKVLKMHVDLAYFSAKSKLFCYS
jgi:hypothetical protein